MFGLILSALYVAFTMVTTKVSAEVAIASTMGFLWYWHCVFAIVFGIIVAIVFLVSCGALAFGNSSTRGIGACGVFIGTPILLIAGAISVSLFLGGVYCVDASIAYDSETGTVLPFTDWDSQLMIMGCVLYTLGILGQISSKMSSSSNKST